MPAIGATTQHSDIAQARGEQLGSGTRPAAVGLAHQDDGLPMHGEIGVRPARSPSGTLIAPGR